MHSTILWPTRDKTMFCQCLVIVDLNSRVSYSLIAFTKSLKDPYVKRGSGSSLKNILRAPVVTWMSSHLLSSSSTFSSDGGGWREAVMETRDHYSTINIMRVCVCLCRECVFCVLTAHYMSHKMSNCTIPYNALMFQAC